MTTRKDIRCYDCAFFEPVQLRSVLSWETEEDGTKAKVRTDKNFPRSSYREANSHRCHRYPEPVIVNYDHWCGEFRKKEEVLV